MTSTSATKKQRKPLTEAERVQILSLHAEGVSTHEVSKRVGRARGTIRGFLKNPEKYGRWRCASGRRTKLDPATQQFIMKEAIRGGKTYAQIVEEAPIKMSVRTLQRFLRKCSDARRGRPLPLPVDISTSSSNDEDYENDITAGRECNGQQQQQQANTSAEAIQPERAAFMERDHQISVPTLPQSQAQQQDEAQTTSDAEPTRREMMQLIDRRFYEMTQKLTLVVEGQNALIQLLLQAKGGENASSSTSSTDGNTCNQ